MNLQIQTKSGIPIYEQIKQQIKDAILKNEFKAGELLPSIRLLAADLKISVITTKRAYEELEKEGLIYSVQGKGFYVDNPDIGYLEEKKLLGTQQELAKVLKNCKQANLSKEQVLEMVDILWEESEC